jgi:8-oxo-dGTP pyrophosphatase MutT (NUDIX family)
MVRSAPTHSRCRQRVPALAGYQSEPPARRIVMTTRQREVACALLIDTRGHLLLRRRDDIPGILQPGKVDFFGGHREGNET